jgi:hypothetical protein
VHRSCALPSCYWAVLVAMAPGLASAQTAPPERGQMRPELAMAAKHLAAHPHPYGMSEEVARVRLQKLGFEKAESLKPAANNVFEADVIKEGRSQHVAIDRITGAVKPTQ